MRAVLKAGAHPHARLVPDNLAELMLESASDEQLAYTDPLALHAIETIDRRLAVWAESNTKAQSTYDPKKAALMSKGRRPIMAANMERAARHEMEWVGTLYPTDGHAQDAEMSTGAYADFVFKAGLLDHPDPAASWRKLGEAQQRLIDLIHDQIAKGKTEYRVQAGNGTGPDDGHRRPRLDQLRRPCQLPRRRGLQRPGRRHGQRDDSLQLPRRPHGPRVRGRGADLPRRRCGGGQGRQGGGVPAGDDRPG